MRKLASLFPRDTSYYLLGLLLILFIPPMLTAPLGRDQGIFAWVASVILEGGMPYSDAWDIKGPLVYYVYALSLFISGGHIWAVYLPDIVLLGFSLVALARVAQQIGGQARYGAGVVLLLCGGTSYICAGQPDAWAGYACILMMCWLIELTPASLYRAAFKTGLMLGCLALFKPHFALLVPAIMAGLHVSGQGWRSSLLAWSLCDAVCLAIMASMAGWLVYNGAWQSFIEAAVFVGQEHYNGGRVFSELYGFALSLHPYTLLVKACLLMACAGLWSLRTLNQRAMLVCGGFLAAAVLIILLQGKYFRYQLLPALFVAALPVAICLHSLFQYMMKGRRDYYFMTGSVVAGILVTYAVMDGANGFARWSSCFLNYNQQICGNNYRVENYTPYKLGQVASYIGQHTQPGDRVYVWGADAGLYVAAERRAASSLGYSYPLLARNTEMREGYQQKLLADLARSKPTIIAVGLMDASPITDTASHDSFRNSIDVLPEFVAFSQLIANCYRPAYENSYMRAYIRLKTCS